MHNPTNETRSQVKAMAAFGIRQEDIAAYLGITDKTLRVHYREELDKGAIEATVKVAESLFRQATKEGNTAAAIFWMKSRAGWSEKQIIQHQAGAQTDVDLSKLSNKELQTWRKLLAKASPADD